jgi:hypothetical protein
MPEASVSVGHFAFGPRQGGIMALFLGADTVNPLSQSSRPCHDATCCGHCRPTRTTKALRRGARLG